MPRRHSLDLTAAPTGEPLRQPPPGDHVIAALALFVAAFLGLAGIVTGHQPVLFAFAAAVVAGPPLVGLLLARAARRRRRRAQSVSGPTPWDDSVPDPVTGVPVLADFERELGRVLRRAEPDVTVVRLALVPVGGTVDAATLRRRLVLAAVNWQEVLRPEDRLARVADDRFAVLLRDCPLAAAARVIDRLRDATPPGTVCAVGVATWDRQESAKALLERADAALEAAPQLQGGDVLRDPARVAAVRATDIVVARRTGIFDRAAKSLAWLLHVPSITIALVDDRFEHVIGEYGSESIADARSSTVAEHTLGHQCLVTGRPVVASDAPRHPALFDHHLVVSGNVAACATVPVVSQSGHIVGTVSATRGERHAWTADELRLLRSTATRIAAELERLPRMVAA
jgi:GGDEF domain-containing protein